MTDQRCFNPNINGDLFEAWLRHLKASDAPDADLRSMRMLDPKFEPNIVGYVGQGCRYAIIDLSKEGLVIERFHTRQDALSFLHRLGMRDGSPAGTKAVAERFKVLENLHAVFMRSVIQHVAKGEPQPESKQGDYDDGSNS